MSQEAFTNALTDLSMSLDRTRRAMELLVIQQQKTIQRLDEFLATVEKREPQPEGKKS